MKAKSAACLELFSASSFSFAARRTRQPRTRFWAPMDLMVLPRARKLWQTTRMHCLSAAESRSDRSHPHPLPLSLFVPLPCARYASLAKAARGPWRQAKGVGVVCCVRRQGLAHCYFSELRLVCFPLLRHFKSAPVYSHKSQEEARLQQCHGLTPPCLSLSPNAAWCTSILLWRLHLGRGRRYLHVARASRLRIELPGHPEL